MLDLNRWNQNVLCPIKHFAIRYRIKTVKGNRIIEDKDPSSSNGGIIGHHSWILVSSQIKPEFGSMFIIRELIAGTWYELSVLASSDAGDTETRYLFATLTLAGATVEPLHFDGYNRRHLGSMIGVGVGSGDSLLEDPMILIPATCAILVLLVVGAATAFIFITRSKDHSLAHNLSDHCK